MRETPWRKHKRQRLAEVLQRFRSQHRLSHAQFAELAGFPVHTVRAWGSGKRLPSSQKLRILCRKLGLNYDALFGDGPARDWFFEKRVLGVDVLQTRYSDVVGDDTLRALSYTSVAAVLIFNELVLTLDCSLHVSAEYRAEVVVKLDGNRTFTILVQARGVQGLGFVVKGPDADTTLDWQLLTQQRLNQLDRWLHNLNTL